MRRLYFQLGLQGKTSEARDVLDEAIELLEAQSEPGQVLAELYACRSEAEMFAGRSQDSLSWASRALELPRSPEITLMALHLRGNARCELGDYGGVDDLREALTLSQDSDMALHIVTSYSYLVERVGLLEGPTPALEMNQAAVELCERRGLVHQSMWSRTERMWLLFDAGRWDEITEMAERLRTWSLEHGEVQVSTVAGTFLARVLRYRGDTERAVDLIARAIPAAEEIADLQVLSPALFVGALVAEALGDDADAAEQLRAYHDITVQGPSEYREIHLPEAVRCALRLGDRALATTLLEGLEVHEPRMSRALDCRPGRRRGSRREDRRSRRPLRNRRAPVGRLGHALRTGPRAGGPRTMPAGAGPDRRGRRSEHRGRSTLHRAGDPDRHAIGRARSRRRSLGM